MNIVVLSLIPLGMREGINDAIEPIANSLSVAACLPVVGEISRGEVRWLAASFIVEPGLISRLGFVDSLRCGRLSSPERCRHADIESIQISHVDSDAFTRLADLRDFGPNVLAVERSLTLLRLVQAHIEDELREKTMQEIAKLRPAFAANDMKRARAIASIGEQVTKWPRKAARLTSEISSAASCRPCCGESANVDDALARWGKRRSY